MSASRKGQEIFTLNQLLQSSVCVISNYLNTKIKNVFLRFIVDTKSSFNKSLIIVNVESSAARCITPVRTAKYSEGLGASWPALILFRRFCGAGLTDSCCRQVLWSL